MDYCETYWKTFQKAWDFELGVEVFNRMNCQKYILAEKRNGTKYLRYTKTFWV